MSQLNADEGAIGAGENTFGIAVTGDAGVPRRGAVHLVDFLPRLRMTVDGAADGGSDQQLHIAWFWADVPPGAGDEGNKRNG